MLINSKRGYYHGKINLVAERHTNNLTKQIKSFEKKLLTKFQSDVKLRKSLEGDKEMVFEN